MTNEERFWSHVEKTDGCWLWKASRSPNGYGHVKIDQVQSNTHRMAWIFANGPIPEGMCVLHRCDVKACVRPDHLWLGTKKDNRRDCIAKGRHHHNGGARGEANKKAKLTPAIVQEIRKRHVKGQGGNSLALANEFGVNRSTVLQIARGKGWKWLK